MKTRIRPVSSMSNHTSRGDWDPARLRIPPGDVRPTKPVARRGRKVARIQGRFIAGPVDFAWMARARQLGVTPLWVGLCLWHLRGLRRLDSFAVSNIMARDWGVQPDAKRRALVVLERAGLISVTRAARRSPVVTLVVPRAAIDSGGD